MRMVILFAVLIGLIFGATQVIPVITLNVAANIGRTTARAKVSSRINRQARNKYRILKWGWVDG